jgi:hypothetical protein
MFHRYDRVVCPVCNQYYGVKNIKHHIKSKHGLKVSENDFVDETIVLDDDEPDEPDELGDETLIEMCQNVKAVVQLEDFQTKKVDYVHQCDECGRIYVKNRFLMTHQTKAHGIINHRDISLQCPDCLQMFEKRNHLMNHMIRHYYLHKCDLCGQNFPSKYSKDLHKRTVHGIDIDSAIMNIKQENIELSATYDYETITFGSQFDDGAEDVIMGNEVETFHYTSDNFRFNSPIDDFTGFSESH